VYGTGVRAGRVVEMRTDREEVLGQRDLHAELTVARARIVEYLCEEPNTVDALVDTDFVTEQRTDDGCVAADVDAPTEFVALCERVLEDGREVTPTVGDTGALGKGEGGRRRGHSGSDEE
jgi:hypothetical protein